MALSASELAEKKKKKKEFIKWLLKLAQRRVCSLRCRTIKQTEVFWLMKAADATTTAAHTHNYSGQRCSFRPPFSFIMQCIRVVSLWNAFKKAANFKMLIFSHSVTRIVQPLAMKVTSTSQNFQFLPFTQKNILSILRSWLLHNFLLNTATRFAEICLFLKQWCVGSRAPWPSSGHGAAWKMPHKFIKT